jgi:hypothetical protein
MLFATDINLDGRNTNDLLYIPADGNVIIQKNASSTWTGDPLEQWNKFLASAGVEGSNRILKRYELSEPWARQLDLHYELGLPTFRDVRSMLTADVTNILAMIDKEYGNVRYVANQNTSPVTYQGIDTATGKPIYRERAANTLAEGVAVFVSGPRCARFLAPVSLSCRMHRSSSEEP